MLTRRCAKKCVDTVTFEEWRSTRQKVACIGEALGTYHFGAGYVYRGHCFVEICQPPHTEKGRYCLTIENFSECGDDLCSLEAMLWAKWAADEVV
jgi:hypothetical protein